MYVCMSLSLYIYIYTYILHVCIYYEVITYMAPMALKVAPFSAWPTATRVMPWLRTNGVSPNIPGVVVLTGVPKCTFCQ